MQFVMYTGNINIHFFITYDIYIYKHAFPITNVEVSDLSDIANTIAQTFSNYLSSENYSNKFQSFRRQAENQQLIFKCSN